jgi:beta-lactamase class A
MTTSRRSFLATGLAAAGWPGVPSRAEATIPRRARGLDRRIVQEFSRLPGRTALKISAPAVDHAPAWSVSLDPEQLLFCASAFKGFVLAEYLRQTETGTAPLDERLPVDETVWSLSAPVLTGEMVTGRIEARTALEAMIAHSDNTGTDIALKRARADLVRAFIGGIGLRHTHIPNTTRQFFGYLAGVPNWETVTWNELLTAFETLSPGGPSIVNDVQTMASTANDFVSFYSRALQGEFFANEETLITFRSILALAADIPLIMPLGVSAFQKSGSIDFRHEHALTLAGGVFIPDRRWVYYSFLSNWVDGEGGTSDEVRPFGIRVLRTIFAWITDAFGTCH